MSIKILLAVAIGGDFGATARHILTIGIGYLINAGFPYSTLVVNVIGSFVLGSLIEIMDFKWIPGEEVRSFLVVGALGSFTTFSAFSQDVVFLMERGELSSAALYIALSVILSISGIYTGMILFRQILV